MRLVITHNRDENCVLSDGSCCNCFVEVIDIVGIHSPMVVEHSLKFESLKWHEKSGIQISKTLLVVLLSFFSH
jgi:hypothetical protein